MSKIAVLALLFGLLACGSQPRHPTRHRTHPTPAAPDLPTDDCKEDPDRTSLLPKCIQTDRGLMWVEAEYIPGVVQCEIAGVTHEPPALEAQAIAARTYLARYLARRGEDATIPIGPRFQCWRAPRKARSRAAAAQTADLVMSYKERPITANYVSGARRLDDRCAPRSPEDNGYDYDSWDEMRRLYLDARKARRKRPYGGISWTEVVVTRNEGQTGDHVAHTPMGHPGNGNRGALAQYAAICLAKRGYDTVAVLRYFYGDDVVISSELGADGLHGALPELVIPGEELPWEPPARLGDRPLEDDE